MSGPELATFRRCSLLLIVLAGVLGARAAEAATYSGLLVPDALDPPIPVVMELEESRLKVAGSVTTSSPLTGEGRIVEGVRKGYECKFKSDLGAGRTLSVEGFCLSRTVEGRYTLQFPDATLRSGELRLSRIETTKPAPTSGTAVLEKAPTRTTAACLTANAACLAACPRGEYNAEFLCSNRCRLRLVSCRGKAAAAVEAPVDRSSQPDLQ